MKEVLIDKLEADMVYFEYRISEMEEHAQNVVDEYYTTWKQENKKALILKKLGLSVEVGTIGPRINSKKGNGKVYIEWQQYKKAMVFEKNNYGKYIKPYKTGYSDRQFAHITTNWEYPLVIETEQSLSILRTLLENFHELLIKHKASIRLLKSQLEKEATFN